MPFIIENKPSTGGGGGGTSEVLSINGKKGNVYLSARDVGAISNVLNSVGGMQVGRLSERPITSSSNMLFIATDVLPNEFYRYNTTVSKWEQIGGAKEEVAKDILAIEVLFNKQGTNIVSTNLQSAIVELNNLIKDNDIAVRQLITANQAGEGKVKTSSTDGLDYLNTKVDGVTLVVSNNKLVAKNILGVTATAQEINYLQGVKSAIQAQIDSLSNVGNFTGAVDSKADLTSLIGTSSDMAIVVSDESKDGASTIYMHNGTAWIFVGEFKAEVRNFGTNPLSLNTEITGVLSDIHIDSSIARKTDIINSVINSTDDLSEGIVNLYYSEARVSNNTDVRENKRLRHEHSNLAVLNKLGELPDGRLTFDGRIVEGEPSPNGSVDWVEF